MNLKEQIGQFNDSINRGYVWKDVSKISIIELLENIQLPAHRLLHLILKDLLILSKKPIAWDEVVCKIFR